MREKISFEIKQQAVETYLTGQYTQQIICEMFKIRSTRQLKDWLKVYNSGRDFKRMSGGSRMKKHTRLQKRNVFRLQKSA